MVFTLTVPDAHSTHTVLTSLSYTCVYRQRGREGGWGGGRERERERALQQKLSYNNNTNRVKVKRSSDVAFNEG